MSNLEIALLGTPHIRLDGQLVAFESRKATALLALLAVAGEPRQRSELATMLWPESDNKRARGALRYTLSVLQNGLGKAWFQTDRERIGLVLQEQCTVDITKFQRAMALGSEHMHTPDTACGACVGPIQRAVELYRDDFLAGFSLRDSINFDEWHFFQREAFRHQLAGGLRCLIRYNTQQSDYDAALTSVRRLLQLDPLQESVQREAMQLYSQNKQWELAIQQYESCADLLDTELGVSPSPATTQLYEQIREQRLGTANSTDPPAHKGNKPPTDLSPSTSDEAGNKEAGDKETDTARSHSLSRAAEPIMGRDRELVEIHRMLIGNHCQLVTLLGPGGIGKTRLALQIAHDAFDRSESHFVHGIYFVPLVAIETADSLVTAIANAMEFTFSGNKSPTEQLCQYLRSQELLIVLDNFEQLVSSASLLSEFLNAASGITFLVTSRERLNLHEEWLYEVQGLPLPSKVESEPDVVLNNDAVQLFAHRARRLDPRFDLVDELPSVVQVCRLLRGMPLGIELAAGWVRTFSTSEIARQIQVDLDFLATPMQNVPERHRSLRAAFLHSWGRLSDAEKSVFAKAAIFRGGFTLDAATAVAQASPITLGSLVDKSLIQRGLKNSSQPDRYNVHELLRQYAEEMLDPAKRADTQQQHCCYFASFVDERAAHRSLASESKALDEIRVELENVRAAWGWLIGQIQSAQDGPSQAFVSTQLGRLIPMLAHFFQRFSLYTDGQQLFLNAAKALRYIESTGLDNEDAAHGYAFRLAQVEARLAELAFNLSHFQEVVDTYQRLLPLFRQSEEGNEIGGALIGLGKALVRMGRYAEAEPLLLEGLSTFRITQSVTGVTNALNGLGILYSNQGYFKQARPYYEEFLAIARGNEHQRGIANALNNLGSNYARAGLHEQAEPLYQECYRFALDSGEGLMIAASLSNLGSVSRVLGNLADSRSYYAESLSICREIGERRWTAAGLNGLGQTLIDDGAHDEAQAHLLEALATAQNIDSMPDMLDSLAGLGEIALVQGKRERALSILRFVANHPVTQTLARKRSRELLEENGMGGRGGGEDANEQVLEMADVVRLVE